MRGTYVTNRKNKTSTNVGIRTPQIEIKDIETKDNYIYNKRKFNNLNIDINKILRTINILFDFKNFQKYKLQPLEKVSSIFI